MALNGQSKGACILTFQMPQTKAPNCLTLIKWAGILTSQMPQTKAPNCLTSMKWGWYFDITNDWNCSSKN